MQADNLFNKKLQALNGGGGGGNMGPPINTTTAGGGGVQGSTPAMPKMGVRARVSDWPGRKDIVGDNRPPPRYDSLVTR